MTDHPKATLMATRNDLPDATRERVVNELNARLADAIDLQSQVKYAHWNVKGPQFIALHELFDEISDAVLAIIDDVAERAVQLGGTAGGTVRVAAERSALDHYPEGTVASTEHVDAIAKVLAQTAGHMRAAIGVAEAVGDAATADLFTEVVRTLDKKVWLVEAHNQATH